MPWDERMRATCIAVGSLEAAADVVRKLWDPQTDVLETLGYARKLIAKAGEALDDVDLPKLRGVTGFDVASLAEAVGRVRAEARGLEDAVKKTVKDGHSWAAWYAMALEAVLVDDAVTVRLAVDAMNAICAKVLEEDNGETDACGAG